MHFEYGVVSQVCHQDWMLNSTKYEKMIYCANCGDSRAVLCRNGTSIELNVCHNTSNPTEVDRILEAGGLGLPSSVH